MPGSSQVEVFSQLRSSHQRLEQLVDAIDSGGLHQPSACSQWSVGQVVAHLGSGAEIALEALRAGLAGSTEPVAEETMQRLWAEYDTLDAVPAASRSMTANATLVEAFENLTPVQLADARVPFMMGPVPTATFAAFRLSEHAVHTWDVDVTRDGDAELDVASAAVILENVATPLIGRLGRPSDPAVDLDVRLTDRGTTMRLELGDPVTIREDASTTAADGSLVISTPGFVRLVYGRLDSQRTPDDVSVTGTVSLDGLRETFPGF